MFEASRLKYERTLNLQKNKTIINDVHKGIVGQT